MKFANTFLLAFLSHQSLSSVEATASTGGAAFTFDDTSVEDWFGIRSMLDHHGVRATFFVSGYQDLSLERRQMLRDLAADGHEIAAHSCDHANAQTYCPSSGEEVECTSMSNEERAELYMEVQVRPELEEMMGDGLYPRSFAYPFGAELPETTSLLLGTFDFVRGTSYFPDYDAALVNCEQGNRFIGGIGMDVWYNYTDAQYDEAMDTAVENGETLVLYGHAIHQRSESDRYYVGRDRLRSLIVRAQSLGLEFRRVRDLCTNSTTASEGSGLDPEEEAHREMVTCSGREVENCHKCVFDAQNMYHGESWCNGQCVWRASSRLQQQGSNHQKAHQCRRKAASEMEATRRKKT